MSAAARPGRARRVLRRVRWSRVACLALAAAALALATALARARGALRAREEEAAALRTELDLVRVELQRERAAGESARAERDRLRDLELPALRTEYARARRALRDAELDRRALEHPDRPGPRPDDPPLAAPIEGAVLEVQTDGDPALVRLSVGIDDGVTPGLCFTVFRPGQFLARVVVVRALRDAAVCRVLIRGEGQEVRPGDRAATRLS